MQELLRCCAADFYLNRAGELGLFFEEHGHFMLFRYGYDENVKVDLGALHYSPRFAWGGRPHRRFISVRERG